MVKVLDREAINRMVGRTGSSSVGVGGGGSDIDLSSYATKSWTDDNYVGKEFFSSLFKAYDSNGNEILPNDTDSTIDNIKAMFGFWTEFYISALGTGGQSTVGLRLAQLADVNVAGVTNGQVLTYDTTSGKWIASTPQSGTDMATVWSNLAASGNQQINASHLTSALNGYATQTWVTQQGYLTSSAISDMATKTWVGNNYLPLTGGTITGNLNVTGDLKMASKLVATQEWVGNNYISIAFFGRLFKAYNGNTQVNPNDTTTTIDNIKAMFGFWTEFYVSALGTGGQSTVGLRLSQLADVNVAGVTDGQALVYDATNQKWVPGTAGGGTDMQTIWAQMALSGNEQINYSHISNAVKINNGTITIGSSTITPLTSVAFNDLTAHPTTISGYGITDAKIVNGAITLGTNTIAPLTQSTGDNRYLKLSGGELTGLLKISTGDGITDASGNGMLCYHPSDWTGVSSSQWGVGAVNCQGVIRSDNNPLVHYKGSTAYDIIDASGGTISGTLVLSKTQDASGTADNGPALVIGGTRSQAHIEIDSNEIMAKSNASTTTTLYLNAEGGNCIINETAGNCGIGTGSPSHKLHVNGGIYSTSYVTALSDARHKDVIGDTGLTVEQIAGAPAIRFQWNDRDDQSIFAGSIAQYWQKVLPEVVQSQADDTLTLDYQVTALMAAIVTARKVVNHETRLRRLEKMFALNDNDLED